MLPTCLLAVLTQPGPLCPIGLQINVPVHGGQKEIVDAVVQEQKVGCNLMETTVKWSDLETSPGKIDVNKLKGDLGWQNGNGFLPFVTLQTIDTDKRTVPADLATEPWDSPKMAQREGALLDAITRALPERVGGVMLGNEVDGYLSNRKDEVAGYETFLQCGRKTVKDLRPDVKIGVTTMFNSLSDHREIIEGVNKGMDLVSFTYYPLGTDFGVKPVTVVKDDFKQMVDFAADRKVYIQEAGYPASELLNSGERKQSAFVDALFDASADLSPHLAGVCYFLMVDFNDDVLNGLVGYYSLPNDHRFRAMLGTLGLKKQDGTPRLAWNEFLERMKRRQ